MQPQRVANDWSYQEDAWLLARVQKGEHDAFETLVRRHSSRFYRVAYRFMRNRAGSEDIVQEAFVKLWERPGMWQAEKNVAFTTWFHRVVVNLCLDHHKKKRPLPLIDEVQIMDERQSQEEDLLENERQSLVARAIALLPERQRVALNLCFYEGLSNEEAARIMGVRLKALQSLLMRAKLALKDNLKEEVEAL